VSALHIGQVERRFYELFAWVIMPNHVHLLLLPRAPLPTITRWLKGSTARAANRVMARTGQPFWQDESYDHWARNESQFVRIVGYIEDNPVSAGLVERPESWPYSSAAGQATPLVPPTPPNQLQ
jgi:REP element-mobilizing transposase RayT